MTAIRHALKGGLAVFFLYAAATENEPLWRVVGLCLSVGLGRSALGLPWPPALLGGGSKDDEDRS